MDSIKVYRSIAKKYDEAFKGENMFMNKFVKGLPKASVILDLGCGTGEDTKYMAGKGFKVISIDNSNEMLKIARKGAPDQRFIQRDMRELNYPNENFNGIVAAFSLIHVRKKEVEFLVKKFSIWLKKNGFLYIALQEGKGETIVNEPFDPGLKVFLNLYKKEEATKLLSKYGFKIIFNKRTPSKSEYEFKNRKIFIIAKKM